LIVYKRNIVSRVHYCIISCVGI